MEKKLPPIVEKFLHPMYDQLGGVFTIMSNTCRKAKVKAKSAFTLGLVVGYIYNRFIRDGVGFNLMVVDVENLTVEISVAKDDCANALKVIWNGRNQQPTTNNQR